MFIQILTFVATLAFVWLVLSGIRAGFPVVYGNLLKKLHLDAAPTL